jgi:nitric oxide reductase NorD protein
LTHVDYYGFLAAAIADRRVSLRRATLSELAYSDGHAIFLPSGDQAFGDDLWRTVAAQAALIGAGSLQPFLLRRLVGRPLIAQRYLYLEMLRAAQVLRDRLPWSFTARLEPLGRAHTDSAQSSFDLATTQKELPPPPAYFGRILPLFALRAAVTENGLAALTRRKELGCRIAAEVPEFDDERESSTPRRMFQNPFASDSPLTDLLNAVFGAGVSKQNHDTAAGESGGAELPIGRIERIFKSGVNAVLSMLPIAVPDLELAANPAFSYPEWDSQAQVYRRGWVSVEQTEAWREDGPQELGRTLGPAPMRLRRQLSGLGVDQETHRRQNEGSDLDLGALIDRAIELRTGHSPPSLPVYRTGRPTRRDLAVTIVVDISGSTGEQPQYGDSIFKKQLQVAYQLGHVLDSLGDLVSMFGFHSWGRKLVRVIRIKGHKERWSLRVAERMALLEPVGYTRIGAAIRHGTHLLHKKMRLPNRLLVLVTDGIAYDQDYELTYAAADARMALVEARAAGTACVCLSVGSGTDTKMLSEVFGGANILAVHEVTEVTGRIRVICRHALASVSKRRLGKRPIS